MGTKFKRKCTQKKSFPIKPTINRAILAIFSQSENEKDIGNDFYKFIFYENFL